MTACGLVIDADRIKKIGYRRFARVLEREYGSFKDVATSYEGKPSIDSTTARCIYRTIVHVTKDMEGQSSEVDITNKLQDYRTTAQRVVQLAESHAVYVPHAAATKNEPPTSAQDSSQPKPERIASATPADADNNEPANGEVTSGQRIKFLLQDQKDLSAKDLETEQRTQTQLINELTELTSMLKDSTLEINRAVNLQNIQLTAMAGYAAENRDELESQKQKMKENTTVMATSVWATVWLIVWVLLMFSGGYAVIRLFPAPRGYPTCPLPTGHPEL